MKKAAFYVFTTAACGILDLASRASAQGSLTPPGPLGPTMVTLNQIEPRIPIASAPYIITAPGSYYLTGDLIVTNGDAVDINASGVTLDLNGFTITTTDLGNTGNAITINGGSQNIRIHNGNITSNVAYDSGTGFFTGGGFNYGISYAGNSGPTSVRVNGVGVTRCLLGGIVLGVNPGVGLAAVVESCSVYEVGGFGIEADSVANSSASTCGDHAIIGGIVNNSFGSSTASVGVFASGSVENCFGSSSGTGPDGFACGIFAVTVQNSSGVATGTGLGINAIIATSSYGVSAFGPDGISANVTSSCVSQTGP